MDDIDEYLDTKRAARIVGFSHRTLEGLRCKPGGPPFLRLANGRIRYRKKDLIGWLENGLTAEAS